VDINGFCNTKLLVIRVFWTFSVVWYSREHDVSETDPVSETSCSLDYQMEKVQKPSNSVCYTPSSEPFRIFVLLPRNHTEKNCGRSERNWTQIVCRETGIIAQRDRNSHYKKIDFILQIKLKKFCQMSCF
jgi:hypothetical protein